MSDNKDNSRELFELLNELHGDDAPDVGEENASSEEKGKTIDEILSLLSSESGNENGIQGEDASEPNEIPDSIFSHLSEEGSSESPASHIAIGANNPHFTDETEPSPPLPSDQAESEEDDEDGIRGDDGDTKVKKVGRFFRGMSFIPKAMIYIALVIIASAYLSYYVITVGNDVFALVTDSREVTIVITEDDTDKTVAKLLEEKGVIKYGWVYELYMKYRGDGDSEDKYIPGEHVINQNYNYSQIINALTKDNAERIVVRVTIPEGYTTDQIIDLLVSSGVGERQDYIEAINNYPYKWDFVRQLDEIGYSENRIYRLEGYLYPDTYEFYNTEDEVFVINKMLNAFHDKFWTDFVKEGQQENMLENYGMTFDDVVTLASMIQSEGGTPMDFYYIAYVFRNRLSHPGAFPKLESDATIQYVLPERISDPSMLDIGYDSPYNTYLYEGLPPGAICNPGLDALSAVLFPEAPKTEHDNDIDAYYFVSNNAGKTYYSSSLEGHEKNKQRVKEDNLKIEEGTYEG